MATQRPPPTKMAKTELQPNALALTCPSYESSAKGKSSAPPSVSRIMPNVKKII